MGFTPRVWEAPLSSWPSGTRTSTRLDTRQRRVSRGVLPSSGTTYQPLSRQVLGRDHGAGATRAGRLRPHPAVDAARPRRRIPVCHAPCVRVPVAVRVRSCSGRRPASKNDCVVHCGEGASFGRPLIPPIRWRPTIIRPDRTFGARDPYGKSMGTFIKVAIRVKCSPPVAIQELTPLGTSRCTDDFSPADPARWPC